MREIKFRAWDKERNRMLEFGLFDLDCGQWDTEIGSINDFPIMQYTGLKDKKGKEIYEGDIIKIDYEDCWDTEEKGKVEEVGRLSVDGCFPFNYTSKSDDPGDTDIHPYHRETAEVIGNIYENPELLKTA
jgi:uncharacterized phage protein (TIGR01671 family)